MIGEIPAGARNARIVGSRRVKLYLVGGVKEPLAEGQSFPLTLTFAKAGKIETTVQVKKVGAMSSMDMGHMEMKGSGTAETKGMPNMNMGGTPGK